MGDLWEGKKNLEPHGTGGVGTREYDGQDREAGQVTFNFKHLTFK